MSGKRIFVLATTVIAVLAIGAQAASAAKVSVRSATARATGNGGIATATATCPNKRRAIGGGFSASPPVLGQTVSVYESRKVGQKSWVASAQLGDPSPQGATVITTVVYCAKGAPKTKQVSQAISYPAQNSVSGGAGPSCPGSRSTARSGGFVTDPPVVGTGLKTKVYVSRGSNIQWIGGIIGSTLGPGNITTFVDCAKTKEDSDDSREYNANVAPVSGTGTQATATVKCKGKTTGLIGGFDQRDASVSSYFLIYESHFLPFGSKPKKWEVRGVHYGPGATTLTANMLCAPPA